MRRPCFRHLALTLITLQLAITGFGQKLGTVSPDQKMVPGGSAGSALSSIYTPDLFDGSLNFRIPIFQYSNDYGDYGVSFTYNTKGVKVDETDGILANHWNVQAESSITRVIKDLPDELNYVADSLIPVNGSGGTNFVPNKNRYLKGRFTTYTETAAQQAMPNVYRDGECDDYVLSIGGTTLTFNLGKDMKVFTHPHRNIQVTMMINGVPVSSTPGQPMPQGEVSFLVQDEQGNRYYFTKTSYIQYQINTNTYGWEDYLGIIYPATTWGVSKIVFAEGQEIRYRYTTLEEVGNYVQYYQHNSDNHDYQGKSPFFNYCWYVQLASINYPNGTSVNFNYEQYNSNGGRNLLNAIRVSSGNNCLKYTFQRDLVNDRRFLKAITLSDCNDQVTEPFYSFEYIAGLPARLNHAQDFFGFYNNEPSAVTPLSGGTGPSPTADEMTMTIPKHGATPNYGNSRNYVPLYAQCGLLSKVTNAYGGSLSMMYRGHTAVQTLGSMTPSSDPAFVGRDALDGVCIDQVWEQEPFHPENKRITSYFFDGGQIFLSGGYFHAPVYMDSATGNWQRINYQGMFLTPHQLINGSNHGYTNVSVKTEDQNGNLLGFKRIRFSNMIDEATGQPRYYKAAGSKDYFDFPYTDKQYLRDWAIGQPLETTEYDENNRPVSRTINFYEDVIDDSYASGFTSTKTARVNSGTPFWYLNSFSASYPNQKRITDTYYPFTGKYRLSQTVVQKYTSNTAFITDTVAYTYDGRNNLQSILTLNSKGEKIITKQIYNYDVGGPDVLPQGAAPGSTLWNMTVAGLEKIVSTERWKAGTGSIQQALYNSRLLSGYINVFSLQGGLLRSKGLYNLKAGTSVGYTDYTGMSMGGPQLNPYSKVTEAYNSQTPAYFEYTSEVLQTDAKGNPLETWLPEGQQYKAMIWDTASGQKLAEVVGARYSDIAYCSFETGSYYNTNFIYNQIIGITSNGGVTGQQCFSLWNNAAGMANLLTGTQSLQAGKEYMLSFWLKGPAPGILAGGVTQSLPGIAATVNGWNQYIIRFTPAAAGTKVVFTGAAAGSFLDEVRLCPASSLMQSWTYSPLFGKSSETDPTGRFATFGYDVLGRQNLVRDQEGHIISKTQYTVNGPE